MDRLIFGVLVLMLVLSIIALSILIPWLLFIALGIKALWVIAGLVVFLLLSYLTGWFMEWMN